MANIVLLKGNRYSEDAPKVLSFLAEHTATRWVGYDGNGFIIGAEEGVDFVYDPEGFRISGTITSISSFLANGQLIEQFANLDVDVAIKNYLLIVNKSIDDFIQYLLRGDDNILGSSGDDRFKGSKGSDVIDGGEGVDILSFKQFNEGIVANFSSGLKKS